MIPKNVRRLVLERAQGQCERCGDPLGIEFSVHHRKLKSQGGRGEITNLTAICGSGVTGCHGTVHSKRLEFGEPEGFIVPSWADPAAVPILHWDLGRILLTDNGYEEAAA